MCDGNKQALAFVYCEDDPGRRAAANLPTRDEPPPRQPCGLRMYCLLDILVVALLQQASEIDRVRSDPASFIARSPISPSPVLVAPQPRGGATGTSFLPPRAVLLAAFFFRGALIDIGLRQRFQVT